MSIERQKVLSKSWRHFLKQHDFNGSNGKLTIGLAASFTIDPLVPYLGGTLLECGISNPHISLAHFNQILKVCHSPEKEFGGSAPDILVISFRLEDLGQKPADRVDAADQLVAGLKHLRSHFKGTIIVGLPVRSSWTNSDITVFSKSDENARNWYLLSSRLIELSHEVENFYTIDLTAIAGQLGQSEAMDWRKDVLFRQPFTEEFYEKFADALARIIKARRGGQKKCLVLDCDNTLWGGIIGEDGLSGIELSDDYPGRAFRLFQQQVLALSQTGIFIALVSKNNPEDVWEVFDKHDAMVLRRANISAARINWRPKSENIWEIAAELNIGIDALVFMDDSSLEIDEVRTHAPEVICVQIPSDLTNLECVMKDTARHFDRLEITKDDKLRVAMMQQESNRADLAQKLTEAEFLASLNLEISIAKPNLAELARVTQLINKTNQFNVSTKRYAIEEVQSILASCNSDILRITVKDRFGEYGLVGVVILHYSLTATEIDSFLMSCRVLGRGVETAMFAKLIDLARARGSEKILGKYVATRKNAMVQDLFARHGFRETANDIVDGSSWERNVESLEVPSYLVGLDF